MGRSDENRGFRCAQCGLVVRPLTNGSYRNHCPRCLWSRHVDRMPGDRASSCKGMMAPVGLRTSKKGWQVVHRCVSCGVLRVNRIATWTEQADDARALARLGLAGGSARRRARRLGVSR